MTYTSGETIVASRIEDRNDKNQVNGYIGLDSQKMPPSQILMPFNLLKVAASGNIFDMTQSNSGNLSINNSGGSVTLNVLGQYNSIANINSANKYTLGSYSGIPLITTFRIDSIILASGNITKIGFDTNTISDRTGYRPIGFGNFPGSRIYWQKFIASKSTTITGLNVRMTESGGNVRVGLYSDNAGVPDVLLAESNSTTINNDLTYVPFIASYSITSGTAYWTAVLTDGFKSQYYKTVPNGVAQLYVGFGYGPLPNPATGYSNNTEEMYTELVTGNYSHIGVNTENAGIDWFFKTYNGTNFTSSNIAMISSNDVLTMYLTNNRAALIKNNSWVVTHTTNTSSNFVLGRFASLENGTSSTYSGYITLGFMG